MGRKAKRRLEGTRQAKAIDPGCQRQIIQPDVLVQVRVQVVPRHQSHGRQTRVADDLRSPQQMSRKLAEQRIQRGLPHNPQLRRVQGLIGIGDQRDKRRLATQGAGKTGQALVRRILMQRPQLTLDPLWLQIEHRVSEAASSRRVTVMKLARLQQECLAGSAVVQDLAAMKLLHALLGKADQIAVMPMRVIGMPLEMGANGLDARFKVLVQVDPAMNAHHFDSPLLCTACAADILATCEVISGRFVQRGDGLDAIKHCQ
ncbi:hypothetical protein D9M68_625930 [compost metagenome]